MITFTEKGAEKVQEFLASQSADVQTSGLRVGVRGGGCSGFQYALAFDQQRAGDEVFMDHGLRILVDGPSPALRQGRGRRLRRVHAGRRLQGREPERHRGLRLRLFLPRGGRGRSLRGLAASRCLSAVRVGGACASTTTPPPGTASRSASCSGCSGRAYERVPIDIFGGDTLTCEYAMINPLRETPVLELDDGERIAQSNAILWYLAEGTPFLPDDALERALVAQWLSFEQERVMGGLGNPRFRLLTGRGRGASRRGWRPAAGRWRCSTRTSTGRAWVVGDAPIDRRPRPVPVRQRGAATRG